MSDRIVTEIVVDARGVRPGTEEYRQALASIQGAMDTFSAAQAGVAAKAGELGRAVGSTGQAIAETGRQFAASERSLSAYLAKLDPAYGAAAQFRKEQETSARALETLDRQYTRGAISADQYAERIGVLSARARVLEEASRGLATGSLSAQQALDRAGQSASALGQDVAQAAQKFETAQQALAGYLARIDIGQRTTQALAAEQRQAAAAINTLSAQVESGAISVQQYNERLAILQGRSKVIQEAAAGMATGTVSAQQALRVLNQDATAAGPGLQGVSVALRQVGVQSIDVFQGLATGAPIMTTFIQQGSQIAQVMANAGASISGVARALGGLLASYSGVIAAVAGIAALGVAVYKVVSYSSDLAKAQRDLGVAIEGVGRSADLSSAKLTEYVKTLRLQGVAIEDATKSIAELARSGLSAPLIDRIVQIAPDAAAGSGRSIQDTIKSIADAAKGSGDEIIKFADAFNLLTGAEQANIRALIEHGDKARALDTVLNKLTEQTKGLADEALSPAEKATRALSTAWGGFMDRVLNSAPVLAVIRQLSRDIQSITNLIGGASGSDLSAQIVAENAKVLDLQKQLTALEATKQGLKAVDPSIERQIDLISRRLDAKQKEVQDLIERARNEIKTPLATGETYGPPAPTQAELQAQRDAEAFLNQAYGSTKTATIEKYRNELARLRDGMKALGPVTEENATLYRKYEVAIKGVQKQLDDATKSEETKRTSGEKTSDTIAAQIRAQEALVSAYQNGRTAVADILATQEAEKKAISEGLTPATEAYRQRVANLTADILRLKAATGQTEIAKQVADINDQVDAQKRIAEAYDGTAASITRAQNIEKARAEAIKQNLLPGTDAYTKAVDELTTAYNRGSEVSRAFQQEQESVNALTNSLSTAFDRLGQGIVDAFLTGKGEAVNFGNVVKAVIGSLLTDFAKFAFLNPLKNSFLGTAAPTLGGAWSALAGGGSSLLTTSPGAAGLLSGAGGSGGILGTASNLFTVSKLTDALGLTGIGDKISSIGSSLGITGDSGILSGITSLLKTPIYSSAGGFFPTFASSGLSQGEIGLLNAAGITQPTAGIASLGGILSGVGGGFSLGSLAGGFVQSGLGKVGPAPQIGAGVGAIGGAAIGSIFPGIGTVLGGLIGGLLGGGGGGLIGPKAPSLYSSTGVNVTDSGLLATGRTFSQLADTSQEVASLNQEISQLNTVLQTVGAQIANGASRDEFGQNRLIDAATGKWLQIGQNTPGRGIDPSKFSTLADAFGGLRFQASGAGAEGLNNVLGSRSFGNVQELSDFLAGARTFIDQTLPALTAVLDDSSSATNQYQQQLDALNQTYADAIGQAQTYGQDTSRLAEAQAKAAQNLTEQRNAQIDTIRAQLDYGRAQISGGQELIDAQLRQFDLAAKDQIKALKDQLASLGASSGDTAELVQKLTDNLAAQRDATKTTLEEQLKAQAQAEAAAKAAADAQAAADIAAQGALLSDLRNFLTGFSSDLKARNLTAQGRTAEAQLVAFDQSAREQLNSLLSQLLQLNATSEQISDATERLNTTQAAERAKLVEQQKSDLRDFLDNLRSDLAARSATLAGRTQDAQLIQFDQSAASQMTQMIDQLTALNASSNDIAKATSALASIQDQERQSTISADLNQNWITLEDAKQSYLNLQLRSEYKDFDAQLRELQRSQAIDRNNLSAVMAQGGWTPQDLELSGIIWNAQQAQVAQLKQQAAQSLQNFDITLLQRTASAANDNSIPTQLQIFDQKASLEVTTTTQELTALGATAAQVADRIAKLRAAQDLERKAIEDQTAAVTDMASAQNAALSVIQQVTQYARSIQTGSASPLSPSAQYALARQQFEQQVRLANAGDFGAMQNLTGYAETFRTASRAMFGSGAGYAQDFQSILSALEAFSAQSADTLTARAFASISQSNTQTMVAALSELKVVLSQIKDEIRHQASGPPADRAA